MQPVSTESSTRVNANSGIIEATALNGIAIAGSSVALNNSASGIVRATGASGFGILAGGGINAAGSVITNSGTIIGTGGTAIKLSAAADTLTLLPGSHIVGVVDMGGNNGDVINAFAAIPTSRVSSLTTAPTLPTIIHFDRHAPTPALSAAPPVLPYRPIVRSLWSIPPRWRRPTAR